MKRILILEICVVLLLPFTVNATGGALRKNSIKTCSNGVTYGLHSDGHGGTHWHVAATNGKNYYATGHAIYSDPCPVQQWPHSCFYSVLSGFHVL